MKFLNYLMLFSFLGFSSNLLPYAISYINDMGNPPIGGVDIYVDRNPKAYNNYLKRLGISSNVADLVSKVGAGGATLGTVLAGATGGVSAIIGGIAGALAAVAKPITEGIKPIIRAKAIDAFHEDIKVGNGGRGAEWNWESIQKQTKVPEGGPMYVWITPHGKLIPLFQIAVASNGNLDLYTTRNAAGEPKGWLTGNVIYNP